MGAWGSKQGEPSVTLDRDRAIEKKIEDTPEIKMSKLELIAKTGDILLYCGNGFFSELEERTTNGIYSHVAMIFRNPYTGELLVWESTIKDDHTDVLTDVKKGGPRLIPLVDHVTTYYKKHGNLVCWRAAKVPQPELKKMSSAERIRELIYWMRGQDTKVYEIYPLELAVAYTKIPLYPGFGNTISFFCSELIADTWKFIGFPIDRETGLFTPQDFSELDENLWRNRGYRLGYGLEKEYKIEFVR